MSYKEIIIKKKANYYAGWPSDDPVKTTKEVADRLIKDGFAEEAEPPKPKRRRTRKKKDE